MSWMNAVLFGSYFNENKKALKTIKIMTDTNCNSVKGNIESLLKLMKIAQKEKKIIETFH